jgi:hypothetical protein
MNGMLNQTARTLPSPQRISTESSGDRCVLARAKIGDLVGAAEVAVVTGKVQQGVGGGDEPELRQFLGPGRTDAGQPLQWRRQAPVRDGGRAGWGR